MCGHSLSYTQYNYDYGSPAKIRAVNGETADKKC